MRADDYLVAQLINVYRRHQFSYWWIARELAR